MINREAQKRKGQLIRFRGQRIEGEDKMTKYHFALNAARFQSSQIAKIKLQDGTIVNKQKDICTHLDSIRIRLVYGALRLCLSTALGGDARVSFWFCL